MEIKSIRRNFSNEILKIDSNFFRRLKESSLWLEDKVQKKNLHYLMTITTKIMIFTNNILLYFI